jgi:hypothetical protein
MKEKPVVLKKSNSERGLLLLNRQYGFSHQTDFSYISARQTNKHLNRLLFKHFTGKIITNIMTRGRRLAWLAVTYPFIQKES